MYPPMLMRASQHRLRRRASVLMLAALLLVPIALSGHTHSGPVTHPCSVCAVTHHAPIVSTPALPTLVAALARQLVVAPPTSVGQRVDLAPRTGRAPPPGLLVVIA